MHVYGSTPKNLKAATAVQCVARVFELLQDTPQFFLIQWVLARSAFFCSWGRVDLQTHTRADQTAKNPVAPRILPMSAILTVPDQDLLADIAPGDT